MARPVTSFNGRTLKFVAIDSVRLITDKSHALYDPRIEKPLDSFFAADVAEKGIRQPIAIRADGTILAGRQRYRAAKECGMTHLPVIVFDGELSDAEAFMYAQAENVLRVDDDAATRVANARRLFDMGAALEDVSRTFRVPMSTVKSYLNIIERAEPEVLALVEENAIPVAAASTLADQTPEIQREAVEEIRASQMRALTAPDGKDVAITGSQKGDTRLESNPETGEVKPVTSAAAVRETVAKVQGRKRESRKPANREGQVISVKAIPSTMRSEATIQQRIARLTLCKTMHKGAAPELDLAIAALKWTLGEDLETVPEGVNAAAFTAAFVDQKA
jgi:ParB-like chromosome segregation protein Spo0J